VKRKRPDGTGEAQGLELLGDGKQAVLAGTHPKTGQPYSWYAADGKELGLFPPPAAFFPVITDARLWEIYEGVLALIEAEGYTAGAGGAARSAGIQGRGSTIGKEAAPEIRADIATLFEALPNTGDWDWWVTMGHALIGALGKSAETHEMWERFSERFGCDNPETTAERWAGFPEQRGTKAGAGTILQEFDAAVTRGEVNDPEALSARGRLREWLRDYHRAKAQLVFVLAQFEGAETWGADQVKDSALFLAQLKNLDPDRYAELRAGWDAAGTMTGPEMDEVAREGTGQHAERKKRLARGVGLPSDFKLEFTRQNIPSDYAAAMAYLSERFFVVNMGGKAVVGHFKLSQWGAQRRLELEFFSPADFKQLTNTNVNRADGTGGIKPMEAGAAWLKWAERPQFMGVGVHITSTPANDTLNLWESWSVPPAPGDWGLIKDHIRTILCGGDGTLFHFVMAWLANMVQNPEAPAGTALVARGGEGAGKGIIFRMITTWFGRQGLHITSPKQLVGDFNDHLADSIFLFADEAFFAGDKPHEGQLKGLITEPTITVNTKFLPLRTVQNMLHVGMASNNDWVVPAGADARRFCVMDVANTRANDSTYFEALAKQIDGGGSAAFLHYLLGLDLDAYCMGHGINLRQPPKTAALADQKRRSLASHMAWWHSVLETGVLNDWTGEHTNPNTVKWDRAWPEKAATSRLHELYMTYFKQQGQRYRPFDIAAFGKWLSSDLRMVSERGPRLSHALPLKEIKLPSAYELERKDRAPAYALPPLDEARKRFEQLLGQPLPWPEPPPDDATTGAGQSNADAHEGENSAQGSHDLPEFL